MTKISVYHFNNGSGGGVFSVIKNLLEFSARIEIDHHIIYTINKDIVPYFKVSEVPGAASQSVFYYSSNWNFYYTCKQLSKFLPNDRALIVANDWLELGMVSNLGLQNKVIQILHGDYEYYYRLALLHFRAIDCFITVAASIQHRLQSLIPDRKADIKYLRFPVPESTCLNKKKDPHSIIFIGRCSEGKGYHLLPTIAELLLKENINLQWHIVGEIGDTQKMQWNKTIDVSFYGEQSNRQVSKILCTKQFFILPSIAEGMPVSLIESMKAGVVPILNNLPGGIQELVKDGETGFLIKTNQVEEYVQIIQLIVGNHDKIRRVADACQTTANKLFNAVANASNYEMLFEQVCLTNSQSKFPVRIYGSRMDQPWLGNSFTNTIRKIAKKTFKHF